MIFYDHDILRIWDQLEKLEERLSWGARVVVEGVRLYDSMGRMIDKGHQLWCSLPSSRVMRVKESLEMSAPIAKDRLVAMFAGIELSSILDILMAICKDIALYWGSSVLAGGVMGGVAGAFGLGVGVVPGVAVGVGAGNQVGLWLLAFLGLKSLAEGLVASAADAVGCYQKGFTLAWGPTQEDQFGFSGVTSNACVAHGASDIAEGHAIMVMVILTGLVAYLTMGRAGGNNVKAALLGEISQSKRLGPRIAQWLQKNEEQLVKHPQLQPKSQNPGGAGKLPEEVIPPPPPAINAEKTAKPTIKDDAPKKLKPGTPEHKADRWDRYQKRAGTKDYSDWSRQYDTNMRNYQYGSAREIKYREAMGGSDGALKTPLTYRQIDILKVDEMYAGQLKTGPVSLTKENALAIAKDAELVKLDWQVEHILEKGASKPYLNALDKAGIDYRVGPQIP
jgi:hypothetical protein